MSGHDKANGREEITSRDVLSFQFRQMMSSSQPLRGALSFTSQGLSACQTARRHPRAEETEYRDTSKAPLGKCQQRDIFHALTP
jgi:hypothetical protein